MLLVYLASHHLGEFSSIALLSLACSAANLIFTCCTICRPKEIKNTVLWWGAFSLVLAICITVLVLASTGVTLSEKAAAESGTSGCEKESSDSSCTEAKNLDKKKSDDVKKGKETKGSKKAELDKSAKSGEDSGSKDSDSKSEAGRLSAELASLALVLLLTG